MGVGRPDMRVRVIVVREGELIREENGTAHVWFDGDAAPTMCRLDELEHIERKPGDPIIITGTTEIPGTGSEVA